MAVIEQTVILGSLESDILQNNMGGVSITLYMPYLVYSG